MNLTRRQMAQMIGAGLLGSAIPAAAGEISRSMRKSLAALSSEELLSASAATQAAAVRSGVVSAEELTLASLKQIEARNPQLNAIVHVRADNAMEDARRIDAALARKEQAGPLSGVPFTLKDSIDTAGVISTYGTLGRSNYRPEHDATVASRLKAAGAILLGKTNTPELTLSFETDNLVYGRTRNPFDKERSPGGSSGGAAAAVSSSLSAFDIGSDTGGSVRVPSHCCGTLGLKPTQGRVPRTGHAISFGGIHDQLTQLGPIARSVDDLELLLRIIAGPDGHDPFVFPGDLRSLTGIDIQQLKIGWHADNGIFTPESEIQTVVSDAAKALAAAGCSLIESVPEPLPTNIGDLHRLFVWTQDGGAWIQRLLDLAGTTKASSPIASQINPDNAVGSGELTQMMEARDRFRSEMLTYMQGFDALVTPVCGFTAPLYGTTEDAEHEAGYSYTQVYNLAGFPAVVVPCGRSAAGLPIGVQVAAKPWREDIALAVAKRLEQEFGGWRSPFGKSIA